MENIKEVATPIGDYCLTLTIRYQRNNLDTPCLRSTSRLFGLLYQMVESEFNKN